MTRILRFAPGNVVYHVLNRGARRMRLFEKCSDYAAFLGILEEARQITPIRILSYCIMPNHWHLILWPERDGELPIFMQRLTVTHAVRWRLHTHTLGEGHLYQGRYKSFPVGPDEHFFRVTRYVERNALRANLVEKAEQWPWSSLWQCLHANVESRILLSPWPEPKPQHWLELVNQPLTDTELTAIRTCARRGTPYGKSEWVAQTAAYLKLERTTHPRGRPQKI